MAGRSQWTAVAVSIGTQITTAKTWVAGFGLQTKGNSTPSSFVLRDGSTGTIRLRYKKIKSGTSSAGAVGTVGDSEFHNINRPILFGTNLYISVGGGGKESCVATVIYKTA